MEYPDIRGDISVRYVFNGSNGVAILRGKNPAIINTGGFFRAHERYHNLQIAHASGCRGAAPTVTFWGGPP